MRKTLLLLCAFVAAVAARAQEIALPGTASQILTLKGTVGDEVSIKPGVYDAFDIFAVDFGDGVQVIDSVGHQNKGVCVDDGSETWPQKEGTLHTGITEFKGTVAGDGTIKVYGTSDIWYLAVTGATLTSIDQPKLKKVVQFSMSKVALESLDLKGLDDLKIFGFSQGSLKSINVKDNAALTKLTINNNTASAFESLLETLDVSGNANLEELNVMGASAAKPGKLTSLDLSNNPKLTNLYAQYNVLASLKLPAGAAISFANLQNNQLESIDLTTVESLKDIYLNNNKLTAVDLSKLKAGANLYLDGNQLTEVVVPVSVKNLQLNNNKLTSVSLVNATASCKLENNCLTLATLPQQPAGMNTSSKTKKFTYAPQADYEVPAMVQELDLSSQLTVEKGELNPADSYATPLSATTTYSFATASGTALVEGTDYEVTAPGKFKFLKSQTEKVHGVMLNAAFPKFTAAAPYKTTDFTVAATPLATLKGTVGEEVTLTLGVYANEDLYAVDFGDGVLKVDSVGNQNGGIKGADGKTKEGTSYTSATKFTGTVAGDGTIKVYGASDLWYLVISGVAVPTSFDQPGLAKVVQMSLTGANVESIALPATTYLTQFTCNNSALKNLDVTKATALTSLTVNNTSASKYAPQLESLDLSKNTELAYLSLQGNNKNSGKLKKLDLTNNTKLSGMGLYVQYNQLTEVKLAENTLSMINVQNNQLEKLDLTKLPKLKNLYASDNKLKSLNFAKLASGGDINIYNNQLEEVSIPVTVKTIQAQNNKLTSVSLAGVSGSNCKFENNQLTLATIPAQPAGMSTANKTKKFTYAPQAPLAVDETLSELDLSSQVTVAKGELDPDNNYASWLEDQLTTYRLVLPSGVSLVEGIDYVSPTLGKFTFLKDQSAKVHVVMFNAALPKFTESVPFVTTEFTVSIPTAIKDVNTVAGAAKAYNLQGVEVKQPVKGLYILNGKKVVVK